MRSTFVIVLTGASALFLGGASAPVADDYSHVRSVIADCTQSYFPDLTSAPVWVPAYASAGGATFVRRPLNLSAYDVRVEPLPEMGPGARRESLLTEDFAFAATVVPNSSGMCDRIVIQVQPGQIGIATTGTGVSMRDFPISFVQGAEDRIDIPATAPDTARIIVYAYQGGEPLIGHDVKVWADFRGLPDDGLGRTVAHEHLYRGATTPAPSLRIGAYDPNTGASNLAVRRQANAITVVTDNAGEAYAAAVPGFRGGVETVMASAQVAGSTYTVARSVILTVFPRLVHFGEFFNRGPDALQPSEDFPFYLVGRTDDHMFNHFIRSDIGSQVARTFSSIWTRDRERVRAIATGGGQGRWIQLNDMSLEYGGQFKIGSATPSTMCNDPGNSGSHASHDLGIDFDLPSCYTRNGGGYVSAAECWAAYNQGGTPELPLISQALIEEYVIGGGRGVVYVHPHRQQGQNIIEPHHYHIRFNPEQMR